MGSFWEDEVPAEEEGRPRSTALAVHAGPTAGAMVSATETIDLAPKAWLIAQKIAGTDFVPKAMRGKPEAVLAAFLTGHELGLPMMTSLAKIHVVDGRPGLAAETMRSLVLAAGHEVWIEDKSSTAVTVCGQRKGSSRTQKVTWTADDVRNAGLGGKDNHKRYPRAMLTARASAELCRDLFPDVIGGLYAVEEIQDGFYFDQDVDEPPAPAAVEGATKKRSSPAAQKRATARAKAAAAEGPEPEPPPLPEDEEEAPPAPGSDDEVIEAEIVEDDETPAAGDEPDAPPLPEEEQRSVVKDLQDKVERAQEKQAMSRAQKIAMRADELGVDRHHVIAAVTAGAKTSGKELDDNEADLVDEALRRLKVGEVRLEEDDDGWILVDAPALPNDGDVVDGEVVDDEAADGSAPPVPLGESLAEVVQMDSAGWRAHIREKGSTLSKTITQAAHLAHELGVPAPTSVNDLPDADANLQVAILTWLEEESAG